MILILFCHWFETQVSFLNISISSFNILPIWLNRVKILLFLLLLLDFTSVLYFLLHVSVKKVLSFPYHNSVSPHYPDHSLNVGTFCGVFLPLPFIAQDSDILKRGHYLDIIISGMNRENSNRRKLLTVDYKSLTFVKLCNKFLIKRRRSSFAPTLKPPLKVSF